MKIALCTLVLNEIQWLQKLYDQHRSWPDLVQWVFVESADVSYAAVNPEMVTAEGLSTDGTTEFLSDLAAKDPTITHIKHGFCRTDDLTQSKCEARNRYLEALELVRPDYFVVLDADEFYPEQMQKKVNSLISKQMGNSFCFTHREIWHPPFMQSVPDSLFHYEVTGGFWSIPYCRVWRWYSGLNYLNHNTPSLNGRGLDQRMNRMLDPSYPYMVHMGFASRLKNRAAKNRYYEYRGEARDRQRSWYCQSRAVFETWTPETVMPRGAKVVPYTGLIPECFQ